MHSGDYIPGDKSSLPASLPQVLHDDNVVCDGHLKRYSPEDSLHKEHVPLKGAAGSFLPPAGALGMDPKVNDHLLGEHWYSLCERQNLQYGPKFRMVQKYAGDRSWTEIRSDPFCCLRGVPVFVAPPERFVHSPM